MPRLLREQRPPLYLIRPILQYHKGTCVPHSMRIRFKAFNIDSSLAVLDFSGDIVRQGHATERIGRPFESTLSMVA